MNDPLVTVGIPFYNNEKTLLDSIKSIFAQTFQDWELLLVDDGSTDGSLEIARSIDDPRVRVISDGQNKKLAARLNQIAQAAKGKYIARMDADDLCHSERFTRQLEFLKAHQEVDVVGTSSCILDEQSRPARKDSVATTHNEIFKDKFKKQIGLVHPSLMAKADWFRRWPYDEKLPRAQDFELWLRCCNNSVFANIPDLLYFTNEFISYSISEYAEGIYKTIRTLWKYESLENGRLKVVAHICRLYLKLGVYAGLMLLGLHGKLISRRTPYRPLSPQEHAEVVAALDVIRKTKVPIRGMK